MNITISKIAINNYNTTDFETLFSRFTSDHGLPVRGHYGDCPFPEMHTNKGHNTFHWYMLPPESNGLRKIWAKCLHTSCATELKGLCRKMNRLWVKFVDANGKVTLDYVSMLERKQAEEKMAALKMEKEQRRQEVIRIAEEIKKNVPVIPHLPTPVFNSPSEDTFHHLSMFAAGRIIFIGNKYDSKGHLYLLADARAIDNPPSFTSTYYFADVNGRRSADNCVEKVYGVLELDNHPDYLTKKSQYELLLSVSKTLNLPLLMALDTGGKSIHGWFHWKDLEPHADVFKELGYDMNTLKTPSQPVRLAGAYRKEKGQYQSIIFMKDVDTNAET